MRYAVALTTQLLKGFAMWLETITVRTPSLARLKERLPELLWQLEADSPGLAVEVYTRFPNSSDLSLHLTHESEPIQRSVHGLRLAAALASFGTVDHALWLPAPASTRASQSPPG